MSQPSRGTYGDSLGAMEHLNRVAVVIGGTSGIGLEVSRALSSQGAKVVVVGRDQERSCAVAKEIGTGRSEVLGIGADATDYDQVGRCVSSVIDKFGTIHYLINAAGLWVATPVGTTSATDITSLIDTNLKSVFLTVNAASTAMKSQRFGKIVNLSSVASQDPINEYSLYAATKAAVTTLTRGLALELAPYGINVNALAPGSTATSINEQIRTAPEFRKRREQLASLVPSGRTFIPVEEIAGLVLFLLSEAARSLHGATILADEGRSAGTRLEQL